MLRGKGADQLHPCHGLQRLPDIVGCADDCHLDHLQGNSARLNSSLVANPQNPKTFDHSVTTARCDRVRITGKPKVRIREEFGTPASMAAYGAGLKGIRTLQPGARVEKQAAASGFLRSLCERYYKSPEMMTFENSTRRVRRSGWKGFVRKQQHSAKSTESCR